MSLASKSIKNVVVLGASYGGASAARTLAENIPENWRVIVIDRNSHANHLYVIPRFTVVSGHEHKAFIPYTQLFGPCPTSNLVLQATVTSLSAHSVTLDRAFPQFGLTNEISFEYCVYALGSLLPAPIDAWGETEEGREENVDILGEERTDVDEVSEKVKGKRKKEGSKRDGIEWLKRGQKKIKESQNVLVIGGGALGIQFASDIKDLYPEKHVTLLHSRAQLLPRFSPLMHNEIARGLEDIGVELLLSTRLDLSSLSEHRKQSRLPNGNTSHPRTVRTTDGRTLSADLVLLCTGQTPNTGLLKMFAPETIEESTGYAKVNRALQLIPASSSPVSLSNEDGSLEKIPSLLDSLDLDDAEESQPTPYGHIFVIGDAADTFGAIKAGHNAYFQAAVASRNILQLIKGEVGEGAAENEVNGKEVELEDYTAGVPQIKLSLGLKRAVYQTNDLIGWKEDQNEDLDAPLIWQYFGAKVDAPGGLMR